MSEQFNHDLITGHIAEQMFGQLLRKKGITGVTFNTSEKIEQLRKYDLLYYNTNQSKPIRIEVKADAKSMTTNNFYIECRYNNNLSGIENTESNFYSILKGDTYYVIPTSKLKELIADNNYHCIEVTDCNTFGYLVPCNDVAEYAKTICINDYI